MIGAVIEIISFNPRNSLMSRCYSCPARIGDRCAEKLSNLPKVIELVGGRTGI